MNLWIETQFQFHIHPPGCLYIFGYLKNLILWRNFQGWPQYMHSMGYGRIKSTHGYTSIYGSMVLWNYPWPIYIKSMDPMASMEIWTNIRLIIPFDVFFFSFGRLDLCGPFVFGWSTWKNRKSMVRTVRIKCTIIWFALTFGILGRHNVPRCSMYGIFTYIYPQNYPNVGK